MFIYKGKIKNNKNEFYFELFLEKYIFFIIDIFLIYYLIYILIFLFDIYIYYILFDIFFIYIILGDYIILVAYLFYDLKINNNNIILFII